MKSFAAVVLLSGFVSLSFGLDRSSDPTQPASVATVEVFTFSSGGVDINGKIYLPDSFDRNDNIPSVYLIDFTEQHFMVALDEFDRVIDGVAEIEGVDAVVVTLEEHRDIDVNLSHIEPYYDIYKDMAAYVDVHYTNNPARTFIGRGSEGGIVMGSMFLEDPANPVFEYFISTDSPSTFNTFIRDTITANDFDPNMLNKKLHFSFSTSNNRSDCLNTISAFENAQYSWLQFGSVEYASDSESTWTFENTYPTAFATGLSFVLGPVSTGYDTGDPARVKDFHIGHNYPNPFTSRTSIEYSVRRAGNVELKVYDLLGNEVMELVNKEQPVGTYTVEIDTGHLSSGVYLYELRTSGFGESKKMIKLN
ncbi:MAG: T9SS type A sorting domain-containing protein [Rhodothermales bacterium]|nr:T9SS type A sorting domain-containing protein [Rhodothermales bacterium]